MPESQVFDTPDGDPCVVCGAVTEVIFGLSLADVPRLY